MSTILVQVNDKVQEMSLEDYEKVHPPGAVDAPYVPAVISKRQFYQALALMGLISKSEALAAIKSQALPPKIEAAIDAITDAGVQFNAQCLLLGAESFDRTNPMVVVVVGAIHDQAVDPLAIWTLGATLV